MLEALHASTNRSPDSQVPSLNPYFELKDNKCTGLWSEKIVAKLAKARPSVKYIDETLEPEPKSSTEVSFSKESLSLASATVGKTRPLSIKVSHYAALQTGITIT